MSGESDNHKESIRVGVRLRPLVAHERGQQPCFAIRDDVVSVIPSAVQKSDAKEGPWRFDCVMDSSDASSPDCISNKKCYELMGRSMVSHALQGFNACLFCYGQTGTGKTTTILGDRQTGKGVLFLLLEELFEDMRQEETHGVSITVSVQMLEVYNERVFDLLVADQSSKNQIEMHVRPGGVQVHGAQTKSVATVEECLELIAQGNKMKHMASTAMNANSSRGHTVFKLGIQKTEHEEGISLHSEVYFADLAGHENEKTTRVTGDRMIELSFINKSLMWLQSAIHSLAKVHSGKTSAGKRPSVSDQAKHLSDFRNSKLTMLLSNALSGNSRVNVIVTFSPAAAHFATSTSSLRFAAEVKRIKVDVHSSAHADPAVQMKRLEQEILNLKEQLAQARAGNPSADLNGNSKSAIGSKELEAMRKREQSLVVESKALKEELQSRDAREQALVSENGALRGELQTRDAREQKLVADFNAVRVELQTRDAREQKLISESRALRDELQTQSTSGAAPQTRPQKSFCWETVDTTLLSENMDNIPPPQKSNLLPPQNVCCFDNPFHLVQYAVDGSVAPQTNGSSKNISHERSAHRSVEVPVANRRNSETAHRRNSKDKSTRKSSEDNAYRRNTEDEVYSDLVAPQVAKSLEVLNTKVENLSKELRVRDIETSHVAGERDRLAGFLELMIDRLGPNESGQSNAFSCNSPPVPFWPLLPRSQSPSAIPMVAPPSPPQRTSHASKHRHSISHTAPASPRSSFIGGRPDGLQIGSGHMSVPSSTSTKINVAVTRPDGLQASASSMSVPSVTSSRNNGIGHRSVAHSGTSHTSLPGQASLQWGAVPAPRRGSPERNGPPRHGSIQRSP